MPRQVEINPVIDWAYQRFSFRPDYKRLSEYLNDIPRVDLPRSLDYALTTYRHLRYDQRHRVVNNRLEQLLANATVLGMLNVPKRPKAGHTDSTKPEGARQ